MNDIGALDDASCGGKNQAHGEIGRVLGEDARGVGDGDAARGGRGDVDVIYAYAEIGDQLEPVGGAADHLRVEVVGDRAGEHIGSLERSAHDRVVEWRVGYIELGVEEL